MFSSFCFHKWGWEALLKVLQEKWDLLTDRYEPKLAYFEMLKRMALSFVSPTMLRNCLWRQVLAISSLKRRRTLTLGNYGVAVASQVGNLDLCFQLRVIPEENAFPEAGERSKGSNGLLLHLGKTPQPSKPMGFSFKLDPLVQILFLQKLKVFSIMEKGVCLQMSSIWRNIVVFLGSVVPRAAGLQFCLLPLWQDAHWHPDYQVHKYPGIWEAFLVSGP